jgi:hypothetical protein
MDAAQIQVVYGVYHLVTRAVNLPAGVGQDGVSALFDPPINEAELRRLGLELAQCQEVTRLLGQA